MGSMALVMWSIPRRLVTLFLTDVPANALAIGLAVSFLKVAAAFQLVDGAQVIGAGMLRGLHDTRWPLIFALVGYWGIGPQGLERSAVAIGEVAARGHRIGQPRELGETRHRPTAGRDVRWSQAA